MTKLNLTIIVCLSTILLSACDPRFETTTEACAINQAVRASFVDFGIKASDDEYQPYLHDMLTALQNPTTTEDEAVSAEQQLALDKINEILTEFMPYESIDDEFVYTNSLDMLEAMISTTNPASVIETDDEGAERNISLLIAAFKEAKQQLAKGISADNGDCRYTNSNIIIENYITENPDTEDSIVVFKNILEVLFRMTYDPFDNEFRQVIALSQTKNDPDDLNNPNDPIDLFNVNEDLKTITTSYAGAFEALPTDFKTTGYTTPFTRSATITPDDKERSITIDAFYDSELFVSQKLDVAEYTTFDAFCTLRDPDGNTVVHDSDTTIILGSTLSINDAQQILLDGTVYTRNGTTPTIDTLINNGETLEINNNAFAIADATVILDEQALLINSSTAQTVTESGSTFSVVECDDDVVTIEPIRDECDGGVDEDGNPLPDERNRRESRTFDLNNEHTDIKRLRVETDFSANEVRVYVSTYKERILDADLDQDPETSTAAQLDDPSRCEKQAILTALSELNPDEGVSLTLVPDPGYDLVYTENSAGETVLDEENAPIPAYTLTGTVIPTRQ